jgi:hypothetical protein
MVLFPALSRKHPTGALLFTLLITLIALPSCARSDHRSDPLVYTVRIPDPTDQIAEIDLLLSTGGRDSLELMLPTWSPGYYRVEDYASKVQEISARAPDGTPLDLSMTRSNRWLLRSAGQPIVQISYRLLCDQRSVTTNWIGRDVALINSQGSAAIRRRSSATTLPNSNELACGRSSDSIPMSAIAAEAYRDHAPTDSCARAPSLSTPTSPPKSTDRTVR